LAFTKVEIACALITSKGKQTENVLSHDEKHKKGSDQEFLH
jgi:hypothetical protein